MIIIINSGNIAFEDLKQAIDDIFAAVTDFDQRSALTLVHPSEIVSGYEQQSETWFVFAPNNIIREEKFVEFVWSKLRDKQNLIKNQDELAQIIIKSSGSSAIIRARWDEYVLDLLKY